MLVYVKFKTHYQFNVNLLDCTVMYCNIFTLDYEERLKLLNNLEQFCDFCRIFKAGLKLDTFYNLLVNSMFHCFLKHSHSFVTTEIELYFSLIWNILFSNKVKEALENDAIMTSTATSGAVDSAPSTSAASTTTPAVMTTTSIIPLDLENTKMAIEVSQSFNNSSSYFFSYLVR